MKIPKAARWLLYLLGNLIRAAVWFPFALLSGLLALIWGKPPAQVGTLAIALWVVLAALLALRVFTLVKRGARARAWLLTALDAALMAVYWVLVPARFMAWWGLMMLAGWVLWAGIEQAVLERAKKGLADHPDLAQMMRELEEEHKDE